MQRTRVSPTPGAKSARLEVRVTPEELHLLRESSTRSHRTVSQLVLSAALQEAERVRAQVDRSSLGPELRQAILNSIGQATARESSRDPA